ncbi:MAG: hypothetical protein ACMUJM_23880 [bacterium]
MADIKRPEYYTLQFLLEPDFNDHVSYHSQMQRLHNERLHSYGIVNGFEVEEFDNTHVTVNRGLAIDGDGNALYIPEIDPTAGDTDPIIVTLPTVGTPPHTVYIVISYDATVGDDTSIKRIGENDVYTRYKERVTPRLEENDPDAGYPQGGYETNPLTLKLAEITLENGLITNIKDTRKFASAKIGDGGVETDNLADKAVTSAKLQSDPDVDGNRAVTTDHIKDSAITNEKIKDSTIDENKFNPTTSEKLVTGGNSHRHEDGDGGTISHEALNLGSVPNPHGVSFYNILHTGHTADLTFDGSLANNTDIVVNELDDIDPIDFHPRLFFITAGFCYRKGPAKENRYFGDTTSGFLDAQAGVESARTSFTTLYIKSSGDLPSFFCRSVNTPEYIFGAKVCDDEATQANTFRLSIRDVDDGTYTVRFHKEEVTNYDQFDFNNPEDPRALTIYVSILCLG